MVTDNTRLDFRIPNDLLEKVRQIAEERFNAPIHHISGKPETTPTLIKLIELGIVYLDNLPDKNLDINPDNLPDSYLDKLAERLQDKLSDSYPDINLDIDKKLNNLEKRLEAKIEGK